MGLWVWHSWWIQERWRDWAAKEEGETGHESWRQHNQGVRQEKRRGGAGRRGGGAAVCGRLVPPQPLGGRKLTCRLYSSL